MYDPATARFLTKDPLEEKGGSPNFYLYCFNDPVNKADPSGNAPQPGLVIPEKEKINWDRIAAAVGADTRKPIAFTYTPFSSGYLHVELPKEARDVTVYGEITRQLGSWGTGPETGAVLDELYLGGIPAAHPRHATYRIVSMSTITTRIDPNSLPVSAFENLFVQADGSVVVVGSGRVLGRMWRIEGSTQWELVAHLPAIVSLPLFPSESGKNDRRLFQALIDAKKQSDAAKAEDQPKPPFSTERQNIVPGPGPCAMHHKPAPATGFTLIGFDGKSSPSSLSSLVDPVAVIYPKAETKEYLQSRPSAPEIIAPGQAAKEASRRRYHLADIAAGIAFMRQKMANQFQTMNPTEVLETEKQIRHIVGVIVSELDHERLRKLADDYYREVIIPKIWEAWDRECELQALREQIITTGPGGRGATGRSGRRRSVLIRWGKAEKGKGGNWEVDGKRYETWPDAYKAAKDALAADESSKPEAKPEPPKVSAEPPGEPATPGAKPWSAPKPKTGNALSPIKMDSSYKPGGENDDAKNRIHYFTEEQIKQYRVTAGPNGELVFAETGKPVNATSHIGGLYVMDTAGNMYVFENPAKFPTIKHSSFFSGGDVGAAGHIGTVDGKHITLTEQTGHYGPNQPKGTVNKAVEILRGDGVKEFGQDPARQYPRTLKN